MNNEHDAGERPLDRPVPPSDEPTRPPPGTRRSRGRRQTPRPGPGSRVRTFFVRTLEVLAVIAGLLATAVIAAAVTFTLAVRSNEVTVPDLSGTSLDGAREQLRLQELQIIVEGNRFHESVPPDFIALQAPQPGTTLKKGRSVRVWVSLGPERRTVPRVEGESLQSAQLILEQAGFSLGRVVEITSDVYAPDTIVGQSPQAYEEVGDLSEVSVLLSRGYADDAYVMPDFIGRDYADLLDKIGSGALKVSQVRLVDYPGVPKNVVVRQVPPAGTKVHKRDRIILYLSKGS